MFTEVISTTDIDLASLLFASTQPISIETIDPTRAVFHFPATEEVREKVEQYHLGETRIEPRVFSRLKRELIARTRV